MNRAIADGRDAALLCRARLVDSDAARDPQAMIPALEGVLAIAKAVAGAQTPSEADRALRSPQCDF